jgi:hypothetical protein
MRARLMARTHAHSSPVCVAVPFVSIMKEYAEFQSEAAQENDYFQAAPCEDNLFEWHFTIRGPPDSDYAGGELACTRSTLDAEAGGTDRKQATAVHPQVARIQRMCIGSREGMHLSMSFARCHSSVSLRLFLLLTWHRRTEE